MSGSCGLRVEANPPLFSSETLPEKTRPPSPNAMRELDLPPMTGSLTVVQPATAAASSRSTRTTPRPSAEPATTDERGGSAGLVTPSAPADFSAVPHDTARRAEQET